MFRIAGVALCAALALFTTGILRGQDTSGEPAGQPAPQQLPGPSESRPAEPASPQPSESPPPAEARSDSPPAKSPDPPPAKKGRSEKKRKKAERKESAEKPQFTAAELADVDEDFALQGEYMALVPYPMLQAERAGLQVLARGGGQFDAVLLRGGLPGAGWDRRTKVSFSGRREGAQLTLQQDGWNIVVDGRYARLQSADGSQAWLEKYHRISPTQDAPPPWGATVLFDGSRTDRLENAQLTPSGLLAVGAITREPVRDFHLHVEFRTPYMPYATGQARGNSGIYIQQRYEVQILDSFGLEGVENECGGLYRQRRPEVNMCFPSLAWQTYDIYFTAARWDESANKRSPARITVLHNGEPIHFNYELVNKTGGGKPEGPDPLPILFQNHRNPVTFRNIWIVPLSSYSLSARM